MFLLLLIAYIQPKVNLVYHNEKKKSFSIVIYPLLRLTVYIIVGYIYIIILGGVPQTMLIIQGERTIVL